MTSPAGISRWGRAWRDPLARARERPLSPLLLVVGLVAVSTLLIALITPTVPTDASGVFYLVAVLAASSLYGLRWGLAASVISALAFNFFFLPPRQTLAVSASSDWLALAAFVATAVVTSDLASRERAMREEADRRAAEARLGESFATLIATAERLDDVLGPLGEEAARALGARSGTIVRTGAADTGLVLAVGGRTLGVLRLDGAPPGATSTTAAERLGRTLGGLLALGEERERRIRDQVAADTLARSNELTTALLRAVTHDLRSPLTAITTAAGGLGYAGLDAEERELLDTIADQSAGMSRMIDDLLDLSRLRAGVLVPASDWTDVRDVVETCVGALAPAGRDRVVVRVEAGLPLVPADDAHLERVVANLVENALKFSPAATQVEIAVARGPEGGVRVTVADRGPGIDPGDAARLLEPFQRAAQGDASGTGLGLAIVDGLARANGWSIGLTPRPGGGTLATVTLPADAA